MPFTLEKQKEELVTAQKCPKRVRTSTEITVSRRRSYYKLCMFKTYITTKRNLKSTLNRHSRLDEREEFENINNSKYIGTLERRNKL